MSNFLTAGLLFLALSFYLPSASARATCSGVFTDLREIFLAKTIYQVSGVKPSLYQRLISKIPRTPQRLVSVYEAKTRYYQQFFELFADCDPYFLAMAEVRFEELPNFIYGIVDQNIHYRTQITVNKKLKNHPFYPLTHAHELQHAYDLETKKISRYLPVASEVIDSEIRAHFRQILVAKSLFSKLELKNMKDLEGSQGLTDYIDFMIECWDSPTRYVATMLLLESDYRKLVAEISGESTLDEQARYLYERIYSVLSELH